MAVAVTIAAMLSVAGGCRGTAERASNPPFDMAPQPAFEALPVASSVNKVKRLLTGMAATHDEVTAVSANPQALRTLVTQWISLPAYQQIMEAFFAAAFQQSQVQSPDFRSVLDNGQNNPNDSLLLNFRQSFAKTVSALVAEHRPFTEVATTTRFMMTTAMMTYFALSDTSMMTDATAKGGGTMVDRFFQNDKNFSWRMTGKNIPLADSGDPVSPNYLTFYVPNLATLYGHTGLPADANAAYCAKIDPAVFNNQTSYAYGTFLSQWLYSHMRGGNVSFFDQSPNRVWCMIGSHPPMLTDADYSDWRMVTVQQPSATATQTRFFDLAGNRNSNTLTVYTPRVGYFTTPAFFAQYSTNMSNQARVTANQTIIVGLGRTFPSSGTMPTTPAPGIDAEHAANPNCMSCHWSLDPMRRFSRSTYTLNFSQQNDATQTSVPGTFLFDEYVGTGSTIFDLARSIAAHPRFKVAWTQKLCEWANSNPCRDDDPELLRIADVFAQSGFDWNALVVELFSSPLVTYASPTATTEQNGVPVAVTRREQLCATLDNRLGLADVCGLTGIQTGLGGRTVPQIAAQLPRGQYSRGVVDAIYVVDPDPFYRGAIEKICALVADMVVDPQAGPVSGTAVAYNSNDPTTAIADIVHKLMGLDAGNDVDAKQILTTHFTDAKAAGANASLALKSAFTLACISPYISSVGQ